MDASAITSEPRDLTPSSGYGCNLLHLRSAFGPTPSKRLHRERSERVSRLVASSRRFDVVTGKRGNRIRRNGNAGRALARYSDRNATPLADLFARESSLQ
jgi:hypothetical protein